MFGLLSAVLEQKTAMPARPTRFRRLRAVLAVVAHATTRAPVRSLLGVLLGLALVVLAVAGLVGLPDTAGPVVVGPSPVVTPELAGSEVFSTVPTPSVCASCGSRPGRCPRASRRPACRPRRTRRPG